MIVTWRKLSVPSILVLSLSRYNLQGQIVVGGLKVPLPIRGNGFLRVLYSDRNCRIFESPRDSPDRWEEAGLVVVQVPAARLRGESYTPGYSAMF